LPPGVLDLLIFYYLKVDRAQGYSVSAYMDWIALLLLYMDRIALLLLYMDRIALLLLYDIFTVIFKVSMSLYSTVEKLLTFEQDLPRNDIKGTMCDHVFPYTNTLTVTANPAVQQIGHYRRSTTQ